MNFYQSLLNRRQLLKLGGATAASGVGMAFLPTSSLASGDGDVHEYNLTTTAFSGTPDGREKELWGYNGQFPGPEIRAKEGDTIRVKVSNKLPDPTSIHWHGMKQRGTWQMDGVTPISRQPIAPGDEFVYEFKAEPAGTHWYHSHTGVQYSEGLYGPLIVEAKSNSYQFDREQVLMIGDWFVENSEIIFDNIIKGVYAQAESASEGEQKADIADVPFESFLFNGQGKLPDSEEGELNSFKLTPGETVRFRIINTSSTFTFKLQFENHRVTVIETDGQPVEQVETDSITIDIGERIDVLLKADQSGSSYIRASTLDGQQGLALLQYGDAEATVEETNTVDIEISAADLLAPSAVNVTQKFDREHILNFSGSMMPYAWPINGKSYPDGPALMVKKGEVVRLVMNNPTGMSHPFHIHGHYFRVLGRPGELNFINPALKDTVSVPANDSLVLQFVADNPGNWFFHCHIEWHLGIGMGVVISYENI